MVRRKYEPRHRKLTPLKETEIDFVAESADDEGPAELPLALPSGKSAAEIHRDLEPLPSLPELPGEEAATLGREWQFTIADLVVVVTCIAVGMAGARAFPHGVFAAVLGVAAFVVLLRYGGSSGDDPLVYRLLMYLAALLFAAAIYSSFEVMLELRPGILRHPASPP
jgi:hypothetical protein